MGIDGLHPVIKPYCLPCHVRELAGHRVGVDASSWIHRGAIGAARELAQGTQSWLERGYFAPWVEFCLKMSRVLQSANVTPVLVFDGCRLPAKAATNQQRRQRRAEARERALRLLAEGREQEAQNVFAQCVDVTPDMAREVQLRLRERGVEFVVAPYEADAQLAYLCAIPEREGGIAAVVTEDSDLVAYGCRRTLFKMDTSGNCLDLSLDRLFSGPDGAADAALAAAGAGGSAGRSGSSVLSLRGWTLDMLQAACVLAGCDFLPSLKGISFRTAAGFVARRRSLAGALKALRLEKRFQLAATADYCLAARRAALAFKHAWVFCPNTAGGSCRRLTPLPELASQAGAPSGSSGSGTSGSDCSEYEDLSHLGAELAADVAKGIAYGYLHPHTLEPFPSSNAAPSQQQTQAGAPMQPSIAGRKQLGSWVASGAAVQPGRQQHGLGPSHPAPAPRPAWQQPGERQQDMQQQQQQQQRATDLSDVLSMYVPQPSLSTMQQQQRRQQLTVAGAPPSSGPHQLAHNPFARQPVQQAAPRPAARMPPRAAADTTSGTAQAETHGSFRQPVGEAGAWQVTGGCAAGGCDAAAAQQQACDSQQGADTAVVGVHSQVQHFTQAQEGRLQRPAMQAITNLTPGLRDQSQQLSSATAASCPGTGSAAAAASQSTPVWDRQEQFKASAAPKPAASSIGGKRKSSGGSSGKKGQGKPLAPPAQRISRFFVPRQK